MRRIVKGNEPPLLRAFKERSTKNTGAASGRKGARSKGVVPMPKYRDLDTTVKEQLVQSLLREQGYTCCYCMGRIDESNMRVEHWRPRSLFPNEQLEYRNLLAACGGNEGGGTELEHCDVKKGNDPISYNPADQSVDVESKLQYTTDGRIKAKKGESKFGGDLNTILNLNCERLIEDRRRAIYGATNAVRKSLDRFSAKNLTAWERMDAHGRLQPYSGAVLYVLRRLAKKAKFGSVKRVPSGRKSQ